MSKLFIKKIVNFRDTNYIKDICKIHKLSYSNIHFTKHLPKKTLYNYYKSLVKDSDITLISIDNNKVNGFVIAGSSLNTTIQKFVRNNILILLTVLLFKPHLLFKKLHVLPQLATSILSSNNKIVSNHKMRLFSIAVLNTAQSQGIGGRLIDALEKELREIKIESYGLSVKSDNNKAIEFYKKNSFKIEFYDNESIYLYKNLII